MTEHGTESMYVHGGCRCDECRDASATARRERNARRPDEARTYWREYKRRMRDKASPHGNPQVRSVAAVPPIPAAATEHKEQA